MLNLFFLNYIIGVSPDSKTPIRKAKVVPASGNGVPTYGGGENSGSANETGTDSSLAKLMEEKLQNSGKFSLTKFQRHVYYILQIKIWSVVDWFRIIKSGQFTHIIKIIIFRRT